MNPKTVTSLACGALLFVGSASLGRTQAASAAPAAGAATPSGDIVQLSEFAVTADTDRGYVASETMTGSRVRTPIIDLPYTVNVMTAEFFEDFALFELADNLVHIGSFTGLDIGGGFTLRGFGSTSQLRDGFYRLGRYGSSNVDRMEVIKGSNAAIYGRTSPGGMVNMISKMPRDRAYYKLTANVGDYRTRRGIFEATGPLLDTSFGKTSYILTASQYERGFDIEYARNRNDEYYLALKHTLPDRSSLTFQAEYFHQTRHAPNSSAPLVIDLKGTTSNLDDEAVGYAANLADYNAFGPNSELNRGNTGFTATYEKRLSAMWSARAAANYYKARRWDYNQNTGFGAININAAPNAAGTVPAISSARGATPNKGLIFEDGGGFQGDVLATYQTGDVKHRTLVTADINDYYRWDPTWNFAAAGNSTLTAWNAVRTITLTSDFRPAAPIQYFPSWFQWGQETLNRLTKRRTTVFGGLLRHQSNFWNDRLLAFAGARYDRVRFRHRDWTTAATSFPAIPGYVPGTMIDRTVNELKPNFGVNYKLTPQLRAFVNYSESYFVNQTDNPNVIAEADYKSEVANGYDYGFKGALLADRLNFTVSGFYAIRENVRVTEIVETPIGSGNFVQVDRRDGDQLVRGFEIDVNWRVNDEVTAGGSFGHVYSIYTDFGSAFPLSVVRKVNAVSPENGSLYLKYAPTRRWRGFSTNLGVTYVSETPTEAPNAGDTYTTVAGQRVLQRTTRQWALTVPSFTLWNIGARYTLRSGRWDNTFAVNVNNIFDRDYLKVNRQLGERRAFYFTYTLGFGPGGR